MKIIKIIINDSSYNYILLKYISKYLSIIKICIKNTRFNNITLYKRETINI